jgi:hypothetical protein
MTPIRANIVGPPDAATRIRAFPLAACHSASLGKAEAGERSMTYKLASAGTNPPFPRLILVLLCGAAMN